MLDSLQLPPARGDETISPALRAPRLRSEDQAREERAQRAAREHDAPLIAGLLVSCDALMRAAGLLQSSCQSERGRVACAATIDALEQLRGRLVFGGA